MKVAYAISFLAAILFVALGVASLLLDGALRSLRIAVGAQEQQVQIAEVRNANAAQALQALEEKVEREEQGNQWMRKAVLDKQTAVQTQQEQINQGNTIAQVAPSLLHDMAEASLKNEKIRQLLIRHGYTVQQK